MRLMINCSHNKTEVVVNKKIKIKDKNSTGRAFLTAFSLLFLILDAAGAAAWQLLFMKTNRFFRKWHIYAFLSSLWQIQGGLRGRKTPG